MYDSLDISSSALTAYRTILDVTAGNIAMRDAVHYEDGVAVPYRRRVPLLSAGNPAAGPSAAGVQVAKIVEDPTPFGLRWDPDHPHALRAGDRKGYVLTSNVDYHTEMVNAMAAARAYEANVTVMELTREMARSTLRLLA